MSRGEILMIVHRIPYPPDKGDKIRSFNQLKFLSEQGWGVHLCTLADDPDDLRHTAELSRYCLSVTVEPINPALQKLASLGAPLRGKPMSAGYFYRSRIQARVDELLETRPLAAVLCFCSPMAEYLLRSPRAPLSPDRNRALRCVMDLVDVDSDKWRQYASRSKPPMKWVYLSESRLLRRYEAQIAEAFDATVLVSAAESGTFCRQAGRSGSVHAVGNGVDLDFFHPSPEANTGGGSRIAFCGAMGYRPNVDAVSWFAWEVLPLIREAVGEVEFCIVGAGAGAEVRALERLPGVRVTGRVPDVRPFVWEADLSVAPVRIARGIQNKVLEAMAMGVATLATPQGFEGVEAEAGRHLLVAPAEPEAFAAAAVEMLRDPLRRQALGRAGRALVEEKYSWQGRLRALEELLIGRPAASTPLQAVP